MPSLVEITAKLKCSAREPAGERRASACRRARDLRDHRRPRAVMTFRSLYRLEARGLLDCPIVGVAVDDWTRRAARRARPRVDRRARASSSTRTIFERFAARLSYVHGDFSGRRRRTRSVGDGDPGRGRSRSSTSRSRRSCSARSSSGLSAAGLTESGPRRRREAVRPRPRVGARAQRRAARSTSTSRSCYRIDHFLGKMGRRGDPATCGSPTRSSSRSGTAHYVAVACRSRWPRTSASTTAATSTTRSARCATSCRTTCMQVVAAGRHGAAGARRDRDGSTTASGAVPRRSRRPTRAQLRPRPVRGLPATSTASPPDSTDRDLRRAAARDRQLALVGRAVLHPRREDAAGHPDRAAPGLQAARRGSGFVADDSTPEPNQLVIRLDPVDRDPHPLPGRRTPSAAADPSTIEPRHGVRRRGRRGRDAVRGAARTPRMRGDTGSFSRQGRDRGDVARRAAPAHDAPPPVEIYEPEYRAFVAEELTRDYGGWRNPLAAVTATVLP